MSAAELTNAQAALRGWMGRQGFASSPAAHDVGGTWAVAYSGGADSTALLLAAQALWPGRVRAFHVHHGLQAAADDFEAHAQHQCASWDVPFFTARVNAQHRSGQSPEDAARQARYRALADLAQQHRVRGVLLGQHAQDQVETLLLALSRGAGLPGLAAMAERFERHGVVFGRPLLSMSGQALRAALDAAAVPYVQDPTNHDVSYTRNRIRAEVWPALLQAFPSCAETLARSARHAAQAQALLDEVAQQDLLGVGNPPRLRGLQALSRARQGNVLRHWLKAGWQASPSEAQLNALLDQVAACTTRGHRIHLKVAAGQLRRVGDVLDYTPLV